MKRVNKWVLIAVAFVTTGGVAQSVCALGVEDFEFASYPNDGALAAKWADTVGSPAQTIDTSIFHGGAQAMKLDYNCSADPFENQVTFTFGANQDWSGFDHFNMWVRSKEGETSLEKLTFQLKDEFGGTLGGAERSTQIGDTWTEWSIDLSGFTSLTGVRQISLDVSAVDPVNGFGSGKLYFDDMSVVSSIPEASTLTLMVLGGLGMVAVLKRNRRSTR